MGLAEEALPNFSEEEKMDTKRVHEMHLEKLVKAKFQVQSSATKGRVRKSELKFRNMPWDDSFVVQLITGTLDQRSEVLEPFQDRSLPEHAKDFIATAKAAKVRFASTRVTQFPDKSRYLELVLEEKDSEGHECVLALKLDIDEEPDQLSALPQQIRTVVETRMVTVEVSIDEGFSQDQMEPLANLLQDRWEIKVRLDVPERDGSLISHFILARQVSV